MLADIWMAELSIHKYLIDSLLYNFFIFSIINKYTKIKGGSCMAKI